MNVNGVLFNADLEEILLELQRQLAINGIQLLQRTRNTPDNIMVQCPYHGNGQERKPSAGIHKDTGIFHCFACNETHELPEVISYCFGHNDPMGKYGWLWLNKNFLSIAVEERKDVRLDFDRTHNKNNYSTNNSNNSVSYISEEELDSYRYIHPYLEKRGIVDEEIIELFDIGYSKPDHCITFPVRDIYGNCLFVAKRNVNTKFFSYPSGTQKPLYGLYELELTNSDWNKGYPDIFVCESMIDCILLWQAGHYALALNGLGNQLQFQQLRDLPCRHLILATDMDEAGQRARHRIKKNVSNKLIYEVDFPKGKKDAGDCTLEELKNLQKYL